MNVPVYHFEVKGFPQCVLADQFFFLPLQVITKWKLGLPFINSVTSRKLLFFYSLHLTFLFFFCVSAKNNDKVKLFFFVEVFQGTKTCFTLSQRQKQLREIIVEEVKCWRRWRCRSFAFVAVLAANGWKSKLLKIGKRMRWCLLLSQRRLFLFQFCFSLSSFGLSKKYEVKTFWQMSRLIVKSNFFKFQARERGKFSSRTN